METGYQSGEYTQDEADNDRYNDDEDRFETEHLRCKRREENIAFVWSVVDDVESAR